MLKLWKKLFLESMTYMSKVLKAMAIRTQNFKIIANIIISVSVLMVNTKNMRIFVKAASFAFHYFASLFHIFSNCLKRWCSINNFLFIAALNGAIFFTRTFGSRVRNAACLADARFFSRISSIGIIAFIRTIFCYTNPGIKNIENIMTN